MGPCKGGRKVFRKKQFTPLRDVLKSKFVGKRLSGLVMEYKIRSFWEQVVGESLSKRTEPSRLYEGFLTVNVASSVLSGQLYFLKNEILKKLEDLIGDGVVKDLRFQVKDLKSKQPPEKISESRDLKVPINAVISEEGEKILESTPLDNETKKILKNIFLRSKMSVKNK